MALLFFAAPGGESSEQHLWRSGLARLASSPETPTSSLPRLQPRGRGFDPHKVCEISFYSFCKRGGRGGRSAEGGGGRRGEEEEEEEEVDGRGSSRSRSRKGRHFHLFSFPVLFPSALSLSLSLLFSPLCIKLELCRGLLDRNRTIRSMVGLPWPLGRRKQATIPPPSIPAFSPSTASPAVSAAHAAPGHLPIRVDPQLAQQVWQGWGTSLCWWANVVGEG